MDRRLCAYQVLPTHARASERLVSWASASNIRVRRANVEQDLRRPYDPNERIPNMQRFKRLLCPFGKAKEAQRINSFFFFFRPVLLISDGSGDD